MSTRIETGIDRQNIPIPGSSKVERVNENLAAGQVEFTEGEMGEISEMMDRYPEQEDGILS